MIFVWGRGNEFVVCLKTNANILYYLTGTGLGVRRHAAVLHPRAVGQEMVGFWFRALGPAVSHFPGIAP